MMTVKDQAQQDVVNSYLEFDRLKACGVLSTGFGKSKVAIDIIEQLNPEAVLILVNSTLLRDYNWREEFIKWDKLELFETKVTLVTYQTAYKWKRDVQDLSSTFIIADEIDFAADTDELSKFFYEYPEERILGLTGFITENKREWFKEHMPVFYEYSAHQAQKDRLLNNIHFVFVKYDLSNNPNDHVVEYVKHGEKKIFTQSENNAYDYANKKVMSLIMESSKVQLNFMMGLITLEEKLKAESSYEYKIRKLVADRNNILLESKATCTIAKNLLSYIGRKYPENKTIVFSKRTKQSILVCGKDHVYNGEIPKKQAEENYNDFLLGKKRYLGVCDKVDRGVNIEGLNTGILETFFGSDTKAAQRLGRLMRLRPDEMATVYILLPYYMRREKDNTFTLQETQQVKWAENMLRSTNIKSSAIWNYCAVKQESNND